MHASLLVLGFLIFNYEYITYKFERIQQDVDLLDEREPTDTKLHRNMKRVQSPEDLQQRHLFI